ncbi:MAG: hypothetical protein J0G94_00540 [Sphingomonadales bacterium]|nr:hypothetical protein [Sphingomonadales bacterium]
MTLGTQLNRQLGMLGMRLIIATLTMMIGYHKIVTEGLEAQMQWFVKLEAWFPHWVLVATNHYAAYVEMLAGFLLFIGLFRDQAIYLVLSVLVIVTIGHSLEATVWDIQQMAFRTAALATLLLAPAQWDLLRIDLLTAGTRKFAGLSDKPNL